MNRPCEIATCRASRGPGGAKGMCSTHYSRLRRYGDPEANPGTPRGLTFEQRFWSKVDRSAGPDECWPWMSAKITARMGYGIFNAGTGRANRRTVYAHRFAWEITNGPIPVGLLACHHCDNPPCCNPAHLFLGTHADNNADMNAKGRARGRMSRERVG